VTSEPQVQASIETALDFGGSLRGVIHCAGIVIPRRVLDKDGIVHPLDLFEKGIQVNLVGTFDVTRLAAKAMAHPSEFAALVGHVIENVMLNGEVIRLDGAVRMPPK
jgi:NAD(P)-dependent dehydrogenase (short-subunit alcohol dehydrogenase family)